MSFQKIIEKFQTNDSELLSTLYKNEFPKLRRFVMANNGNEDQAKDIFQEAFAVTWENIKKGKFIPQNASDVKGYLYRVAKNKWLDFVRSAGFKKSVTLESYHDKMEETGEDKEGTMLLVEKGLKTLGEKCRDILRSFYYQKKNMAEIADAFGWTEQTARNNKYRCIQQLRSEIIRLND
jgi:RNA polymerase sigma factor (sigma-70 family)